MPKDEYRLNDELDSSKGSCDDLSYLHSDTSSDDGNNSLSDLSEQNDLFGWSVSSAQGHSNQYGHNKFSFLKQNHFDGSGSGAQNDSNQYDDDEENFFLRKVYGQRRNLNAVVAPREQEKWRAGNLRDRLHGLHNQIGLFLFECEFARKHSFDPSEVFRFKFYKQLDTLKNWQIHDPSAENYLTHVLDSISSVLDSAGLSGNNYPFSFLCPFYFSRLETIILPGTDLKKFMFDLHVFFAEQHKAGRVGFRSPDDLHDLTLLSFGLYRKLLAQKKGNNIQYEDVFQPQDIEEERMLCAILIAVWRPIYQSDGVVEIGLNLLNKIYSELNHLINAKSENTDKINKQVKCISESVTSIKSKQRDADAKKIAVCYAMFFLKNIEHLKLIYLESGLNDPESKFNVSTIFDNCATWDDAVKKMQFDAMQKRDQNGWSNGWVKNNASYNTLASFRLLSPFLVNGLLPTNDDMVHFLKNVDRLRRIYIQHGGSEARVKFIFENTSWDVAVRKMQFRVIEKRKWWTKSASYQTLLGVEAGFNLLPTESDIQIFKEIQQSCDKSSWARLFSGNEYELNAYVNSVQTKKEWTSKSLSLLFPNKQHASADDHVAQEHLCVRNSM